jgi:hypothetical protein
MPGSAVGGRHSGDAGGHQTPGTCESTGFTGRNQRQNCLKLYGFAEFRHLREKFQPPRPSNRAGQRLLRATRIFL